MCVPLLVYTEGAYEVPVCFGAPVCPKLRVAPFEILPKQVRYSSLQFPSF